MIVLKDLLFSQPANSKPQTKREKALERVNTALMNTLTVTYQNPLPRQVPVVVISAQKGLFPTERFNLAVKFSHQLLAASVENDEHLIAEESGHNIPGDRPDLVISSIRKLLE